MKIFVINAGSSSIKYQLFDMTTRAVLAAGLVERIGEEKGRIRQDTPANPAAPVIEKELSIPTHRVGLNEVVRLLLADEYGVLQSPEEVDAVGHRVVHGGEKFSQPTVINDEVMATIEALVPLAPLHNPGNLSGIRVAQTIFPTATQVAVFDTAFHQTMPAHAFRYAIPEKFYRENQVRVYGFHGTSHAYVARTGASYLGIPSDKAQLITAHLGNGASMTAIAAGKSVDTSMGFSPLPGLIMGTRSGDLDPAVIFFLANNLGMSISDIDTVLNKESGLVGLSGANDLRDIEKRMEAGDSAAKLALGMYAYRIKKYIGAYTAVLGRVDALIFTAGVGENSSLIREMACAGLESLGYALDRGKNKEVKSNEVTELQSTASSCKILVVPTNEELEIALQTQALLLGK